MKLNVIMHEDQVFKHSHIFQNRLIKKMFMTVWMSTEKKEV